MYPPRKAVPGKRDISVQSPIDNGLVPSAGYLHEVTKDQTETCLLLTPLFLQLSNLLTSW